MAEAAHLEMMSLELKCPICLSLLSSAVSLTCNHVFCNLCISTSMKSASNCPVCKAPYRRREVRPAPHMDNLVSIYKSMKAASGVNIFITQNMPSTKEPGEDEQLESGDVTDRQEDDGTVHGVINKRKCNKKGAKVSSKAGNSGSKPVRPSFPAKKRVQVPHHSPLETPIRPNDIMHQEAEQTNNELQKNNPVLNKNCETSFAPFFWLRDEEEEDAEKSTPMSNADPVMLTPPVVPCFSDMKDSDDENPCNLTPTSGPCDAAQDANMFDSEMFEWTQIPCSPELCASPIKSLIKDSVGLDKSLEEYKLPSQEMTKNGKIGTKKSNKRGRKTSDITQRKRTKKNAGIGSSKESEQKVCENKSTSLNVKEKTHKGKKKLSLDTSATEVLEENVSKLAELSNPVIADCSALPVEKRNTELKKTSARSEKTLDKKRSSCIRKRKTQKLITVDCTVTERESNDGDKTVFDLQKNSRESEIKKVNPNDTKVRSAKKGKFMTHVNCTPKSANELQSVEKVPLELVKNSSDERATNGSSKSLNGILRKCEEVSNKIHCGFCQSAEDTDASGLMIHYLKGKPITENYGVGSDIIHAHKNCTEWAPNVYFEDDNAKNLEAELTRSKRIKCSCCGIKGAALGCYEKTCRKSFHIPCAKLTPECRWDNDNFVMLCPLHASSKLPNEKAGSQIKETKTKSQRIESHVDPIIHNVPKNSTSTGSLVNYKSFGKLVICCSGLTNSERETISEFEKIPGVTLSKTWDPSVTHVIASIDENSACKRTLKFLKGILEGKWILNIDWIKACLKAKELVNEQPYEIEMDIHGMKNGPQLGRLRLLNKQPKLFNDYEFYFSGDYVASYKGYLHDLIIAAGGTVLQRKPINGLQKDSPSTFIIYSLELPDKCNQSKINSFITRRKSDAEALASYSGAAVATNSWILSSIAACKLQKLE